MLQPIYCYSCHILLCVCYFCHRLMTVQANKIAFADPKSQCLMSPDIHLFHMFCVSVFCAPILNIFLETIIVSRYCLKFLSSKIHSYWMKGAFVNIIFASGAGIVAVEPRTFLDSNSFFISVSR